MSEDFASRGAKTLGRLAYFSLGSTTLGQLRRSRFVRSSLSPDEERRKPDGIVFLPLGGIKAVIEVKQPSELAGKKLPTVIKKYSPIARAVCNLLIITDGKRSYWINPHTESPARGHDGQEVRDLFDPVKIDSQALTSETEARLVYLIETADHSLSATNNHFGELRVIDPTALARSVWQKIWVNTGKDPEKCLYNVVEILVFKFLSDAGVLVGNYSFRKIVELLSAEGSEPALEHYARISRTQIAKLFPAGKDKTTVINGTIFVNEQGAPSLSQGQLFGEVIKAFQAFDDEFGSLRYIDRQFKTRLYESFLRQQAGIRSLGQYFTPRNVVQAIVRMSNAQKLRPGSSICDPFCGVGGFLLEAIAENPNLWNQFKPINGKVIPGIKIRGYDKGTDEKEDERTIILAKANMLVYLSDLLVENSSESYLREFANNAFNSVFYLIRSNLGSFERVSEDERYDLILTNPPYVTSGSASLKNAIDAAKLENYYSVGGRGTESLAIQWIIRHLKPGGQAFVIVPDGLMNQASILKYIKAECLVRCVVALPSRTFYSTPKKTYILGLEKKHSPAHQQSEAIFTYLVSEIGESRDTRRVPIALNDLVEMEVLFAYFDANWGRFSTTDRRCKILDWPTFSQLGNWLVDRQWTVNEKIALGIVDEAFEVDPDTFKSLVEDARGALDRLLREFV